MNITKDIFDKYYLKSFNLQTNANSTLQEVEFIDDNNLEKDAKILDLVCGYDRDTIEFYRRGFSNTKGMNYNASHLDHFENIGFEVLDVFGNFRSNKYNMDSQRQILIMGKTS